MAKLSAKHRANGKQSDENNLAGVNYKNRLQAPIGELINLKELLTEDINNIACADKKTEERPMTKFSIEYNPYLVKCKFTQNGKRLNRNSKIGAKSEKRLQVLLGESANWKGLIAEIANASDDDEVELTFTGRKIDYDDLRYSVDLYKGTVKFNLVFKETKNDKDIIAELDKIFERIKEKNIPEFKKKMDGKNIFDVYEEVKNGIFEINVIATMSSGKSTLINALLHKELLPAANAACTATITRILDNDSMEGFEAECYASDGNTVIYPRKKVRPEDVKKYNEDKRIEYIDIEGNIPSIHSDRIKLRLCDTPGPNNAGNEDHGRMTQGIIKRTNAIVLYVMNAQQEETTDDKRLLADIAREMRRDGKESRDKFIFVVNKCDALDPEKGETVEKLIAKVRKYLKGFDIEDPLVIPVSALTALLVRKQISGEKLTRSEQKELDYTEDFIENSLLHYEQFANLTPTVRNKLQEEIKKYHAIGDEQNRYQEILIHTGIRSVEEMICEYMDKYVYPMKIHDAVKDIKSILDGLDMEAKFEASIAYNSAKLEKVQEQIDKAADQLSKSIGIYDQFREKLKQIQMGGITEAGAKWKTEEKIEELTSAYAGKTKVDRLEADALICGAQDQLKEIQENCEWELNREINDQIFLKCEEMLEEYSGMIRDVLQDIEIAGFDFEKIRPLKEIKITNINDLKRRYEQKRYHTEIRWKDNPERSGFKGKFKFWRPRKVSYSWDVEDGTDVDVRQVVFDMVTDFREGINKNIEDMFAQASEQVADYKEIFSNNMKQLYSEIDAILKEKRKLVKTSETLQMKVEKNKDKAEWVSKRKCEIDELLTL